MPRTITLNWIDWIVIAIILVSILRGSRWGILTGLGDLVALTATFFASAAWYAPVTGWVRRGILPRLPYDWTAFGTFVVIWFGLYILLGQVARLTLDGPAAGPVVRLLGGLLGGARGLVLATAMLVLVLAGPFGKPVAVDTARSWLGPALLRGNDRVQKELLPALPLGIPRIGPGGKHL